MSDFYQYAESVRQIVGLRKHDFYNSDEGLDVVQRLMWQAHRRKLATLKEMADVFGVSEERTRHLIAMGDPVYFSEKHKKFAHEVIIKNILSTMRVSKRAALSQCRQMDLVRARWVCYHVLQTHLGWSMPRIGKYFNRDHTTVLHGLRGYKNEFALQEFVKMHYNKWVNIAPELEIERVSNENLIAASVNSAAEDMSLEELEDRAMILGDNIKWASPARRKKEMNARLMAGVDYSQHEYNLPGGL